MMMYVMVMLIFVIGLHAIAAKKDLRKTIVGIVLMEYAVVLLLAMMGSRENADTNVSQTIITAVLASGLAFTIMLTAVVKRIFMRYGTFNTDKIRKLKG